jgi:hypothetical protein
MAETPTTGFPVARTAAPWARVRLACNWAAAWGYVLSVSEHCDGLQVLVARAVTVLRVRIVLFYQAVIVCWADSEKG